MIHITSSGASLWEHQADAFIFLLEDCFPHRGQLETLERDYYPNLQSILKMQKFTGKAGQILVLTGERNGHLTHFIFAGVGACAEGTHTALEKIRRAMGLVVQRMKSLDVKHAALHVPQASYFGVSDEILVHEMSIAAYLASYEFFTFKSDKPSQAYDGTLMLVVDDTDEKAVQTAIDEGITIAAAANRIRHYCDMPPNIATPTYLADEAVAIAKAFGLKQHVFGRERALELGMGGFCAVDAGSDEPGKFVVLEHRVAKERPTIAVVGKGVTFDTGGVSLKPSSSMHGMKYDMSGAAAVLGIMQAVAQLKFDLNVIGIAAFVENMPSGKSCRQDDIVTFMNGKTAEIKSTDAEGRLILADALCYAEANYQPDIIIDLATLTGACLMALGQFFTGLMTKDRDLESDLIAAGHATGERVWPLPLDDDFAPAIKGDIADLLNCGKPAYRAGTVTAGLFLSHFVEKARWAHLDIAGTSDGVPGISYVGSGATGVGVRLLIAFMKKHIAADHT